MGFHKFDWMRAVAADTRIPGGEKFVLWYCAAIYVRYGEDPSVSVNRPSRPGVRPVSGRCDVRWRGRRSSDI
jgi:hypothetical protein